MQYIKNEEDKKDKVVGKAHVIKEPIIFFKRLLLYIRAGLKMPSGQGTTQCETQTHLKAV